MAADPSVYIGSVEAGQFTFRQRDSRWRYEWTPVVRGSIGPGPEGTEVRFTIQPFLPDVLVPVSLLVLGVYGTVRFDDNRVLIVVALLAAVQTGIGWMFGVRRVERALRARFDLASSGSRS
jgi:hypothetical protein